MLQVTYRGLVLDAVALGTELINQADADWSSMDGSQPDERIYSDSPASPLAEEIDGDLDDDEAEIVVLGLLIEKAFDPVATLASTPVALTFTITNPNGSALTNIRFSDDLPDGRFSPGGDDLTIQAAYTTDCPGPPTISAPVGGTVISVSDLNLDAGASCTITVPVSSPQADTYENTTTAITSDETGPGETADADLVVADNLAMQKQYERPVIEEGQTVRLTFTLINGRTVDIENIEFSETLPLGSVSGQMEVADPANATTTDCGPGATWNPLPGAVDVSFSGGSLAAGDTCTVQVDVTASVQGVYVNDVDPYGGDIFRATEVGSTDPFDGMPSNLAELRVEEEEERSGGGDEEEPAALVPAGAELAVTATPGVLGEGEEGPVLPPTGGGPPPGAWWRMAVVVLCALAGVALVGGLVLKRWGR